MSPNNLFTQTQRFIATIFLFSVLSQSCTSNLQEREEDHFELDIAQIRAECVNMKMPDVIHNMERNHYQTFCDEVYEIYKLLQVPSVSTRTFIRRLEKLQSLFSNLPPLVMKELPSLEKLESPSKFRSSVSTQAFTNYLGKSQLRIFSDSSLVVGESAPWPTAEPSFDAQEAEMIAKALVRLLILLQRPEIVQVEQVILFYTKSCIALLEAMQQMYNDIKSGGGGTRKNVREGTALICF